MGVTWAEDRDARIYSRRGRVYACARPSGAPVFLFGPRSFVPPRLQLSGRFLAWEQDDGAYPETERIAVLNLRRRAVRHVGTIQVWGHEVIGSGIADFLLTGTGAVVWQENFGSDVGGPSNPSYPFSYTSTLRENSGRGTTVLDQSTNSTGSHSSRRGFPISSIGLSHSERVVYWTDDGRAMAAAVR